MRELLKAVRKLQAAGHRCNPVGADCLVCNVIRAATRHKARLRKELKDYEQRLDAHIKVMGTCLSSCSEGNELRTEIAVLKETLYAKVQ